MYLWKQWHESRIVSAVGLVGLLLLAVLITKGVLVIEAHPSGRNGSSGLAQFFVFTFYLQAVLIGGWSWLLASIGAGKNLGEDSGSFLFTRPRRRASFLWKDWAFGIALIALVTVLSNALFAVFVVRVAALTHAPYEAFFPLYGTHVSFGSMVLLVATGVWLFASLVYSLTYASTIAAKRTSGVMLGAGLFVGYVVARVVIAHYYPSVQLPSPILSLFRFENHQVAGLSDHLGLWIAVRAAVVLPFPILAQWMLQKAEI
jgi:hypothetical protein